LMILLFNLYLEMYSLFKTNAKNVQGF